jgi:hypothetical protein
LRKRKYAEPVRCSERDNKYFPEGQQGRKELVDWFFNNIMEEEEGIHHSWYNICVLPFADHKKCTYERDDLNGPNEEIFPGKDDPGT